MATDELPAYDEECFLISPIGEEGSPTRNRADGVMEYIVGPAAAAVGLTVVRADRISKPGVITRQAIEHVVNARAAVVDLTGGNPNVYYEMAVRHTAKLPTVLIAEATERLPFDIQQMRTIFFDPTDLKSAARCREEIIRHLREALDGEVDSPIASTVTLQRLEQGSSPERALARVVEEIEGLRGEVRGLAAEAGRGRMPIVFTGFDDVGRLPGSSRVDPEFYFYRPADSDGLMVDWDSDTHRIWSSRLSDRRRDVERPDERRGPRDN